MVVSSMLYSFLLTFICMCVEMLMYSNDLTFMYQLVSVHATHSFSFCVCNYTMSSFWLSSRSQAEISWFRQLNVYIDFVKRNRRLPSCRGDAESRSLYRWRYQQSKRTGLDEVQKKSMRDLVDIDMTKQHCASGSFGPAGSSTASFTIVGFNAEMLGKVEVGFRTSGYELKDMVSTIFVDISLSELLLHGPRGIGNISSDCCISKIGLLSGDHITCVRLPVQHAYDCVQECDRCRHVRCVFFRPNHFEPSNGLSGGGESTLAICEPCGGKPRSQFKKLRVACHAMVEGSNQRCEEQLRSDAFAFKNAYETHTCKMCEELASRQLTPNHIKDEPWTSLVQHDLRGLLSSDVAAGGNGISKQWGRMQGVGCHLDNSMCCKKDCVANPSGVNKAFGSQKMRDVDWLQTEKLHSHVSCEIKAEECKHQLGKVFVSHQHQCVEPRHGLTGTGKQGVHNNVDVRDKNISVINLRACFRKSQQHVFQ